jgi:hypothetical protein
MFGTVKVTLYPDMGLDRSERGKSAKNGCEQLHQNACAEPFLSISLDNLVGAGEEHRRNVEAERLG